MTFSIIICTIRRAELFGKLIDCLNAQTHRQAEVLIVGSPSQPLIDLPATASTLRIRHLPAPKGLAPARNVGLAAAEGDVVCFLDDDVLVEPDFVAKAISILQEPQNSDVGGLTGFDTINYSASVNGRWRLRALLKITPSLEPGDASHLGRSVPLSFFQPFSGLREVKWLPGFCQIFRKSAIEGLLYDEEIIVEDRDFSMEVGRNHRLLICGDLKVQHLRDSEARHSNHMQTWRASFGLGRSFAKRRRAFKDWFTIVHVLTGEIIIDLIVAAGRPSIGNCKVPVWRLNGFVSGFSSYRSNP